MKKHYVSLETAKMLKDKGYKQVYTRESEWYSEPPYVNPDGTERLYARAQLHEAQQWLREEHKIHIEISLENFTDGYIWQYQLLEIGNDVSELSGDGEYKYYEQALEEGIVIALKLI